MWSSFASDRKDWLSTPAGERARRRKRQLRQVLARVHQEPKSKNSITTQEKRDFRRGLAEALGKRRGFRASVALELNLAAIADNPPAIHTVAKNYIDLTYGVPIGQGRLMNDDRQIRYLSVRYTLKLLPTPSVFIRAYPMSSMHADVRLMRRVRSASDFDDHEWDNPHEQLRNWERSRSRTLADYGEDLYEAHRRFLLRLTQQDWLARTERLLHLILLDVLAPDPMPDSIELGGVSLPSPDFADIQKNFLFSPRISLNLAPLARRSGDGAVFRQAVESALQSMRDKNPHLFPLHWQLGVVILLVPPKRKSSP